MHLKQRIFRHVREINKDERTTLCNTCVTHCFAMGKGKNGTHTETSKKKFYHATVFIGKLFCHVMFSINNERVI